MTSSREGQRVAVDVVPLEERLGAEPEEDFLGRPVEDRRFQLLRRRLRDRAARSEPVEGRPIADGDMAVLDIDRTNPDGTSEKHEHVPVTLGAPALCLRAMKTAQ